MGYFPNGTAGDKYQARWCEKCHHWPENPDDGGCEVWFVHLFHNYEQHNDANVKEILSSLIPLSEDGLGNEQCRMFLPRQFSLIDEITKNADSAESDERSVTSNLGDPQ